MFCASSIVHPLAMILTSFCQSVTLQLAMIQVRYDVVCFTISAIIFYIIYIVIFPLYSEDVFLIQSMIDSAG